MPTVQARGSGGFIQEMDVPAAGPARERWDEQIAKGDIVIVTGAEWVDYPDGSRQLVMPDPAPAEVDPPKRGPGRPPKVTTEGE